MKIRGAGILPAAIHSLSSDPHRKMAVLYRFVFVIWLAGCAGLRAQDTIFWSSAFNADNRTSTNALMDGGFRFQLGVFQGTFVPTMGNKADWAQNWVAAGHTAYVESSARYATDLSVESNAEPFTVGKAVYVWGFKGDAASGEWILFRDTTVGTEWNWPAVNNGPPIQGGIDWLAQNATAVIGQINPDGDPFLMKSALVTNAAPPTTTWDQWVATDLDGVAMNGPNDDPDYDGTPNLLEFIFGTNPTTANAPTATPVSVDENGYLVITIPRRIDRPATIVVEVSSDLETWNPGPGPHTAVLSNGLSALVVRDLTQLSPANPKRFARVKVTLP